uniref:Ig-like domain-containing protein n=1 Tax=Erpetoichthys calabaricus TaxID=27687 RepID=A0A8C4T726_ERPCA
MLYFFFIAVRLKNFPDKISATMGQNTAIPCHLNPEVSALDLEVRWQKEGLETPVLLYKNRREEQHEQYRGRARLHSDLTKGDLSLILESVRDMDGGRYTCYVRTLSQVNETTLYLSITGHGRKPVITVHKQPGREIRLKCESKGWYPKPELHWNYGDGSAITVHSDFSEKVEEDGRITVTSYLSVQDSYEEDFLCIVQPSDSEKKFVSTFHVSVKLKTSESMCLSEINKNVILPCHLDPAVSVLDSEVKWEKKGLTSPVFLYTNRRVALEEHHEQYKERTQLNSEDKRTGDLSLSLKNVKVTDEGRYTCSVKAHGREIQASLDLSVTAQGGKPVMTVDEEPGNVKLKCISRGWYPKPQLKWTHEDGSAVTEYSELFEEVEHDGRITITSYLSIRDQYDQKILCIVQLSGSKERAVSRIVISRGRPQHLAHLVALICMILVLCYIIMCKKGYAQIKSMFFELFTQDSLAIIVFYLQCKGLCEILLVVAASEINIFLILTQKIQGGEKLKVQNTLLQFVRECLIILGIIWWKINDDSLLLLLAALIQAGAVVLVLGTSQEFCLRCLSASVIATMLIIHFSGVTESILPDFQQNSQIFSHVKEFLSNEGTSKYLLLTLLVMQIFIQHRLFLSEKQQGNIIFIHC